MKFNLYITFSKLMAFLILVAGTVYSVLNHEATVITLAIITSAGIIGWRQQKQKEIKVNEKLNN